MRMHAASIGGAKAVKYPYNESRSKHVDLNEDADLHVLLDGSEEALAKVEYTETDVELKDRFAIASPAVVQNYVDSGLKNGKHKEVAKAGETQDAAKVLVGSKQAHRDKVALVIDVDPEAAEPYAEKQTRRSKIAAWFGRTKGAVAERWAKMRGRDKKVGNVALAGAGVNEPDTEVMRRRGQHRAKLAGEKSETVAQLRERLGYADEERDPASHKKPSTGRVARARGFVGDMSRKTYLNTVGGGTGKEGKRYTEQKNLYVSRGMDEASASEKAHKDVARANKIAFWAGAAIAAPVVYYVGSHLFDYGIGDEARIASTNKAQGLDLIPVIDGDGIDVDPTNKGWDWLNDDGTATITEPRTPGEPRDIPIPNPDDHFVQMNELNVVNGGGLIDTVHNYAHGPMNIPSESFDALKSEWVHDQMVGLHGQDYIDLLDFDGPDTYVREAGDIGISAPGRVQMESWQAQQDLERLIREAAAR
jgi:hypothetical protein